MSQPSRLFRTRPRAAARRRGGRPRVEEVERRLLLSADVFLVDSTADAGPGSLRWAVDQANASDGATSEPATIRFAIPGAGPATIRLLSPLGPIVKPVVIDARAADGSPTIRIDGATAGAGANGLTIAGGDSLVAGLIVTGFSGAGIVLTGGGGDLVQSNYVGLAPGAGGAAGNGTGILIASASNQTVGGPGGLGNVIAGNRGAGVAIVSTTPGDSDGNAVIGNWIGTDAAGTPGLGNGGDGVVFSGATDGSIRLNVVSANQGNGIVLNNRASGNRLVGNVVGLTPDGSAPLGNRLDGVLVDGAPDNAIGGGSGAGNRISGNGGHGIEARKGSAGLTIQGNWIGVDPTGMVRQGNRGDGVRLASGDATVGGADPLDGNAIAYNGQGTAGAGVQVVGVVHHVAILSNRIYGNAGLGINLGNGPTPPNTPPAVPPTNATAPNDGINAPVLQAAFGDGGTVTASGSLWGMANRSYVVQFFWTAQPDPSGYGEGERFLGQSVVKTDAAGRATFSLPTSGDPAGGYLTATATDEFGDTSEFAQTILLRPWTDLHVEMTADPPSGPQGSAVTFTATVANRGFLTAPYAALAMALPAGSRIQSVTGGPGWVSTVSGGGVLLNVGSLAPGATAVLTVVVAPPVGFSGAFQAAATATMGLDDARPGDETATASSYQAPAVDVALALAGPGAAHRGDVLKYVFTASNAGPAAASDVRLVLPIPAGASFVAATSPGGAARVVGGAVVVDLGVLATGASAAVEIDLKADAVGVLASAATLSSAGYDVDPTNQSANLATTVVGRVDLGVAIQAPAVVVAGRDLAYDVVVRNAGPDDARNVVLLDQLPAGAVLVSAAIDGGVKATLDLLAAGASATLRIVVRPTAAAGAVLTTAASVSSADDDGDPSDDDATARTTVRDLSNLAAIATAATPTVVAGGNATFVVQVRNAGPATEPDATLTVAVPPGATLVSATSDRGAATIANGLAVFRLGALAPGDSVAATLVLSTSTPGLLAVTATADGLNVDEGPFGRQTTAAATVLPTVDLATWVGPPADVFERTRFQYVLTTANLSTTAATGATLTAPLPAGVEFVSAVATQGGVPTFDGNAVTVTFGTIAGLSTASVTIVVRPTATAGTTLLLSGASWGDQPDPDPGDDRGASAVKVAPAVDLTLRLAPAQPSVAMGSAVAWTAEIHNPSPTPATGLTITIPHADGDACLETSASQGTATAAAGAIVATLGTLAPGARATVSFLLRPNVPGTTTLVATAAADQHVALTAASSASAVLNVIEPAGTLAFAAPAVAAPENAGAAYLTVVRTDGARGVVTVGYRTVGGAAAAGVNYLATSGVLTFQPGQTTAVIAVPVLAHPHDRGDVSVGVALQDPTGGATLGAIATASLTIQDLDPDFVPPTVGRVDLLGSADGIGALAITLSEPADPASALDGWAYAVYDLGPAGVLGDGDDRPVAVLPPGYDPATQTVYLTPASPLAANRHYAVVVRGAGLAAVRDLAGNPLGGGVDYVALFARGTDLKYADASGDLVTLALHGGGVMDLFRAPSGDATRLTLQAIAPGRSALSGSVARQRGRGDGVTPLGTIEGLGSFGDVRVSLRTPPFLTTALPSPPIRTVPAAPARPTPTPVPIRPRPVAARPTPIPVRAVSLPPARPISVPAPIQVGSSRLASLMRRPSSGG